MGVTAQATLDSVPVATRGCKWLVEYRNDGSPTDGGAFELFAMNDGATGLDFVRPYSKLKTGSGQSITVDVDINAGEMRLLVSAGAATTFTARRIEVAKDVL